MLPYLGPSQLVFSKNYNDEEKLNWIIDLKSVKRGRISEYAAKFEAEFNAGKKPWEVSCDLAFPCATQNELHQDDAERLLKNGCYAVVEGANMPSTIEAIHEFQSAKIMYCPSKAANADGVAVSGLEMTQNSMRLSWTDTEVNDRLRSIMKNIHAHVCATEPKKITWIMLKAPTLQVL
jgi:glutamate dehydrogenase (NADP+)